MLSQASTNADLTRCIVCIELGDIIGNLQMKLFGCIASTDQFGFWIALCELSESVCGCCGSSLGTGAGYVWVGMFDLPFMA